MVMLCHEVNRILHVSLHYTLIISKSVSAVAPVSGTTRHHAALATTAASSSVTPITTATVQSLTATTTAKLVMIATTMGTVKVL
jgi:hypothetical protein